MLKEINLLQEWPTEKTFSTLHFNDIILQESEENAVFPVHKGTLLLANTLHRSINSLDRVLDVGTGSGFLAIVAAKRGAQVVATEISSQACVVARKNFQLNNVDGKISLVQADLVNPIFPHNDSRFDVLIFNLPSSPVPIQEESHHTSIGIDGGYDGRKYIDLMLNESRRLLNPGGKILLVQSNLSNSRKTETKLVEMGFDFHKYIYRSEAGKHSIRLNTYLRTMFEPECQLEYIEKDNKYFYKLIIYEANDTNSK